MEPTKPKAKVTQSYPNPEKGNQVIHVEREGGTEAQICCCNSQVGGNTM